MSGAHRPRVHPPRRRPPLDPAQLLGLLAGLDHAAIVGFAPTRDHVDVHLHDLPPDRRAGTAGLFGLVAPASWTAVGLVLPGTGRSTAAGGVVADEAVGRIVLTRSGQLASEVRLRVAPGEVRGDRVEGLAVDALHRVLGLPCPGEPPELAGVVASIWLDEVLQAVLEHGHVDWPTAVALHPGDPGPTAVPPSTEMLVEATVRAAGELDWERMRRRVAGAVFRAADLTAGEAGWMDRVLFGRWVVASLPEEATVLEVLRSSGSEDAADGLGRVLDALGRRGPSQPQMTSR